MKRIKGTLLPLGLLCLITGLAHGQSHRPPVKWVTGSETLAVAQGEEFDFEASFFSSSPIPNAHWWASFGLEPLFGRTGSPTPIGNVEPNYVYTIRHRIRVAENCPPGLYSGDIQVYHHKEPGNSTQRVYPEVLHVKIYVMERNR